MAGDEKLTEIRRIRQILTQPIDERRFGLLITTLLSPEEHGIPTNLYLIQVIRSNFTQAEHLDLVYAAFEVLNLLLKGNHKEKLDRYMKDITDVILSVLRSACKARVKEKCLEPLNAIIDGPWPDNVPSVINVLSVHVIKKSEKPTVLAEEFKLIGKISKIYPEMIESQAENIGKSMLQTIDEAVEGKVKISFPLLEGCFIGLTGFMDKFFDSTMTNVLYRGLRKFSNPGEQRRHGHCRAILHLIAQFGEHFQEQLQNDYKYWHRLLIVGINYPNRDDKYAALKALFSFYSNIGDHLSNSDRNQTTETCLKYFTDYFNTILSDKSQQESTYELKYAFKGFTTLISKCRAFFADDEFDKISQVISERALLLYRENLAENVSYQDDVKSTEKIEELGHHIEALAAIGINTNKNMENLLCLLITEFKKCLKHRQYIVISAVKQALNIVDIKIILLNLIKETCKYFISTNIYIGDNERDSKITYESFVPLWKALMSVDNSQMIYDEFIGIVLEMLPQFDLSTRSIPITDLYNEESDNRFTDLDNFVTPQSPDDYRYFTNLSDLVATVLSYDWTRDWFVKWINRWVTLLHEGRRNDPNTAGYLRIFEVVLSNINALKIFAEDTLYDVLDDVTEKRIIDIVSDLNIENSTGLIQLRSALVFIQIPPQIMNEDLVLKSHSAFNVIFSIGKTNFTIATNAMNILENWFMNLSPCNFNLLCEGILPYLNDILCFGVSGTNTNYEETSDPQLTELQQNIISFIAKIDSKVVSKFLDAVRIKDHENDIERDQIYATEYLKVSLPSLNTKIPIYLDVLVPHIKETALRSNDRNMRIAACQTLHSIILIAYGTSVVLPPSKKSSITGIQTQLTTAMLYLATDTDEAISNMFIPLLKQTSHWLACPVRNKYDAYIFIKILMEEIGRSNNNLICDLSCQVLNEFIYWSIKKSSAEQLDKVPDNILFMLRTICQMMLYPDDNRQKGGYMLLTKIIPQIYKIEAAIDIYLPELLNSAVTSLQTHTASNSINTELGLKSLDKLLLCLERKGDIFIRSNPRRRKPIGFDGVKLNNIINWLFRQINNSNRNVAMKCIEGYNKLCREYCTNDVNKFIDALIEENGLKSFIDDHLECYTYSDNFNHNCIPLNDLEKVYNSIDSYLLMMKFKLIDAERLFAYSDDTRMFDKAKLILEVLVNGDFVKIHNALNHKTKLQIDVYEKLLFETSWKIYEVYTHILPLEDVGIRTSVSSSCDILFRSLIAWIEDNYKLTIMKKHLNHEMIIKQLIADIKQYMPEKWITYEAEIVSLISKHLTTIFVDKIHDSETNFSKMYLDVIFDIMNSIGRPKLKIVLSGYNAPHIIKSFFDVLFDKSTEPAKIVNIEASVVNSIKEVLNFILKLKFVKPEDLMESLMSDTSEFAKNESSETTYSYGDYCMIVYRTELIQYMIQNYVEIFDYIHDNISRENNSNFIKLIEEIMKYLSEKSENDLRPDLTILLNKLWPKFINWNVSIEVLSQLFSLLTIIPGKNMEMEDNLNIWLLDMILSNIEDEQRNKLIILLPAVLKPGVDENWYDVRLSKVLEFLKDRLPISCFECKTKAKMSQYVNQIQAILDAMANSGSYALLENIIRTCTVDFNHVCDKEIASKMKRFTILLNQEEQQKILQKVFEQSMSADLDTTILLNLTHKFLTPILSNSNPETIEAFYVKNISTILRAINKKVTVTMSVYQIKHIYVQWSGAFMLLENMFLKVPFDNIDMATSEIARNAYSGNVGSRKVIKDVTKAAIDIRVEKIPANTNSDEAAEFLRRAHCSAFKCLYALTIAKPKVDLKFYMALLNYKGAQIWDGIIDMKKEYNFPIKTLEGTKVKTISIPSKKRSSNAASVNGLTLQSSLNVFMPSMAAEGSHGNHRYSLLSQTLKENILKFDLNNAVLRDSLGQTMANYDMKQVDRMYQSYSSMSFDDNDLNNHECMGTLCKLVETMIGNSNQNELGWFKSLCDIMADSSKDRNLRLFMAHMFDNLKEVLKPYSRMIFIPFLTVIKERCTSFDPAINFLDVCLLTTLMSWKIVPNSVTEISTVNEVFQLFINNLTSTEADVINKVIQLLEDYIAMWGTHLNTNFNLSVIELSQNETKKTSLQVLRLLLKNGLIPWSDPNQCQELLYKVLPCIQDTGRFMYKLASDITGLILKILKESSSGLFEPFLNDLKKTLSSIYNVDKTKFIICVHQMHQYCSELFESMFSKVIFVLPKSNDIKNLCLEIILNSIEIIDDEDLFRELTTLRIDHFINDLEYQEVGLSIIGAGIVRLNPKQIIKLIKNIEGIANIAKSTDSKCRGSVYSIMMKIYDKFSASSDALNDDYNDQIEIVSGKRYADFDDEYSDLQIPIRDYKENYFKRCAKLTLLQGLDDDDDDLKSKISEFWCQRFTEDLHERWINVLQEFFHEKFDTGTKISSCILKIILASCWRHDKVMEDKLFENPLEECVYTDYDWRVKGRTQSTSLLPMYAETLNSQLVMSSIIQSNEHGVISRRDVQTMKSMMSLKQSLFNTIENSVVNDSLRVFDMTFSVTATQFNQNVPEKVENLNIDDFKEPLPPDEVSSNRLRRQVISSKKHKAIRFSGISNQRKTKRIQKPLESFKQFKDGDYPDVQITLNDVIKPLLALAMKDVILAKNILVIIFKQLKTISTSSDFNRSSLKYSLGFLKHSSNLHSSFIQTLLEICRNCSGDYHLNEFNTIVGEAAKISGLGWFGSLIIEERQIAQQFEHSSKRFRTDNNSKEICRNIDDRVHSQHGNWTNKRDIYYEAIVDDDLDQDKKLHYKEEYINCFAHLSDWDGLYREIYDTVNTDDSNDDVEMEFNYHQLWKKPWFRDFVLPLIFDANIHRLRHTADSQIALAEKNRILESLNHFDACINDWMGDDNTRLHINSQLSMKYAMWKALYGSKIINLTPTHSAIDWLKYQWRQEFLSRHVDSIKFDSATRSNSFYTLQLAGEILNLLEEPIYSNEASRNGTDAIQLSSIKLTKMWKNCLPNLEDNTVYWDSRLSCRSIASNQIRKVVKNNFDDGEIDLDAFTEARRLGELHLVKSALHQSNFTLAKKFIKQNLRHLNPDDGLIWGLHWVNALKIEANCEADLNKRLNLVLSVWKSSENVRLENDPENDVLTYADYLNNAAEISGDVYNILKSINEANVELNRNKFNEDLVEIVTKGQIFKGSITNYVMNFDRLPSGLIKYGCDYLGKSIEILEGQVSNVNTSVNQIGRTYLMLAEHCRKAMSENVNVEGFDLPLILATSLLRAIKYGNQKARRMFPLLLIEFSQLTLSDEFRAKFKDEIMSIPCWMFVPWVSQLLAYLPNFQDILLDLIVNIAKDYTQSVVHPYRLSKKLWNNADNNIKTMIKLLDSIVYNEEIETLVNALGAVCEPNILLKTHLLNLLETTHNNYDKHVWDESFSNLFKEVFPENEVRGSIFRDLKSYENALKKIWKSGNSPEHIGKGRDEVIKMIQSNELDKRAQSSITVRNIKYFSPYLEMFENRSVAVIELFGQYGRFESSIPLPDKHITITKFEREVVVIGSLRKPVRIAIIGSDGRKYTFLVKRGEDLRQDERIQQTFDLMNDFISQNGMKINTYKVIPLTTDLGLIQWVVNCPGLRDVLYKYDNQTEVVLDKILKEKESHVMGLPGQSLADKYGDMLLNLKTYEQSYVTSVNKISKYLLRNAFIKLAVSPDNFIYMRNNYIRSFAPMNIGHWILGIGDRHMSNCLLMLNTGGVLGIDFGHAFGMATQSIEIPELTPFRLTPQFLGVVSPQTDILRRSMIIALEKFVENSTLLLSVMEVFVKEPTINWLKLSAFQSEISKSSDAERQYWSPRLKIDQCRRKLEGINPYVITIEDLKVRRGDKFSGAYCELLKSVCGGNERKLNATQQVDNLIKQATDTRILTVAYVKWEPWL